MKDKSMKKVLMYIRYPYTAIIIATIWICMAIIITKQNGDNMEVMIGITSLATIFIAYRGFRVIK